MNKRFDPKTKNIYRRLWRYVTPHKLIGFIAVIGMTMTAFVEASLVYLLQPLMDETLVAKEVETGKWIPLAFMVIFVMRGLSGFATEASLGWIGRRVISDLRREVFGKFLTLPIKFFDSQPAGPLLSRLTFNVEMVAESVTSVVTIAVRDILTVLAAIGVMLFHSPSLTIFVAVLFPIIAILVRLLGIAFRRYSDRIQDTVGAVTQLTEEIIRGNSVVKAFNGYKYERKRLADVDENNRKQNLKLIRVRSLGVAITQAIFGFGLALVIFIASLQSIQGILSPGQFISFFSAMMLMLQPVRRITNVNATLQRGVSGADSLFMIIDQKDEEDIGTIEIKNVKGKVEFDDVSFSYDESDDLIINKLNVSVEAGEVLAIVGHSGSGKSTLVNLLPRFYEIKSGKILIDNIAIDNFTLESLRKNISLVSQDVVLFNESIKSNLTYGQSKHHTEKELFKVADAAYISDFLKDLPKGLDTIVGDRGMLLSGGQRQRIAIGRALLKDAPILILDEATSALDTQSERHIQEALNLLMKNRTTLVIAHRLSTVEKADKIIVLDSGKIIEHGTHSELLNKNGHYANLYHMQFNEK